MNIPNPTRPLVSLRTSGALQVYPPKFSKGKTWEGKLDFKKSRVKIEVWF